MKGLAEKIAEMDEMVVAIVGISTEDLYQVKFDFALKYLEEVIGTDTFGLAELPKTTAFWSHWRHLWYRVDHELFLGSEDSDCIFKLHDNGTHWLQRTSFGNMVITDMVSAYLQYHEIEQLSWQMNSAVIEESWHQTIKNLANKSKTKIADV